MRRSEREIREFDDILSVIERCEVMRIAMAESGKPYIVPLNFGYAVENGQLVFYMHSAAEGRKMDILRENPQVCFEMDSLFRITRDQVPCRWSAEYESIIGTGTVVFITEPAEKKKAMDAIMRHYGFEGTAEYSESVMEHTCLYKILTDEVSGKRNLKKRKETE